jgi:hypothetical protein
MFTRHFTGTKPKGDPKLNGEAMTTISEEELNEYKLRFSLAKQQEQLARMCAISLQVYQNHLQEKYEMDERFTIDMQSGELKNG